MWYLYIALCSDTSLYTGITNNLKRREWLHNHKLGAKSLLGKLPVKIIYYENYPDQTLAAKREYEIKGWNRKKKLELIKKKVYSEKLVMKGLPEKGLP